MLYEKNNYRFINPAQVIQVKFHSRYVSGSFILDAHLTMPNNLQDVILEIAETGGFNVIDIEKLFVSEALEVLNKIHSNVNIKDVEEDIQNGLNAIPKYLELK